MGFLLVAMGNQRDKRHTIIQILEMSNLGKDGKHQQNHNFTA